MAVSGGLLCGAAVVTLLCLLNGAEAGDPVQWGYDKGDGPSAWPDLYKRWCSGRKQSPIKLTTAQSVYDPSLDTYTISEPAYAGKQYKILNDGHKVLVDFQNMRVNLSLNRHERECFRPHHVHWHWGDKNSIGSEHWLEGKQYPLEGHIVMWDCRFWDSFAEAAHGIDGLAVLGVFYEIDNSVQLSPDRGIGEIISYFDRPQVSSCDQCVNKDYNNPGVNLPAFSIKELLPKDMSSYFVYYGSLTTPDCRENVMWTVFREPIKIPQSAMDKFRNLSMPKNSTTGLRRPMVNNFRGPMPLNPADPIGARRQLSRSFGSDVGAAMAVCAPDKRLLVLAASLLAVAGLAACRG
ncbi:hypothetical protein BOX15_Mlig011290g2 [Macrostomum lignano]|uniref:Carbonic anhydrase n=1 Tax=Macrostomum lignano TaxID=282301 RepID=A0A267GMI2_9PLAT|nr:hypothetical protein BOX15_Mlig011290g4 [Macrostomum lignano]PAA86634.1 hypothetical protein BOX15_Mlig011290g2 [Macrostomum lignano]